MKRKVVLDVLRYALHVFMSYIIVGLGNPGEEYLNSRHNTGRFMAEMFVRANNFSEFSPNKKLKALVSFGKLKTHKVQLVLPETFMNKSGLSVAALVKNKKAAERLAVIHDDLDIPFGKFKISFNKSAGGHRGVESIIRALKTKAFARIRVGISPASAKAFTGKLIAGQKPRGEEAVNKFILAKFSPDQLTALKKLSKKVSEAIAALVAEGREKAMGQYNG